MEMTFWVEFHGPFRVSTGVARTGADAAVDPSALLPGSSLKGLMRAAASRLLPAAVVDDVFGAPGRPSPWAWSAAEFDVEPVRQNRVRIALEDGVARDGALMVNEEVWASKCSFAVTQVGPLESDLLMTHETVIEFAARSVHLVGADRRRGLGSVTIRRTDQTDASTLARRVFELAAMVDRGSEG